VQGAGGESRADESREQEGPGDGEPTPDARLVGGLRQADGQFPTDEELEARTDLARHLEPSIFPADRQALIESAERHHAPEWILDALAGLSGDRIFENTEAVWEALGGSREARA